MTLICGEVQGRYYTATVLLRCQHSGGLCAMLEISVADGEGRPGMVVGHCWVQPRGLSPIVEVEGGPRLPHNLRRCLEDMVVRQAGRPQP